MMTSFPWAVICLLQIVTLVCERQFRHGTAEGLEVAWIPNTQRTLSSTSHGFDIDLSSSRDKELLRKQGAK